jgi:hypothetical protein
MRRRNKWDCLSNTGYDTGVRWAFEGFAMELEGNLVIHRKPARWWAAALAVTLPVLACVAGVAWFIRGYISPPTIHIPGSMAAVQGDSIVGPSTSETSADTAAPEASTSATLAAASVFPAPPWPADAPPASRTTTEPATVDIPIPRPRPRRVMAETVAAVPLPRPRPRDETNAQEPEETSSPPTQEINSVNISRPTHERHGAE